MDIKPTVPRGEMRNSDHVTKMLPRGQWEITDTGHGQTEARIETGSPSTNLFNAKEKRTQTEHVENNHLHKCHQTPKTATSLREWLSK